MVVFGHELSWSQIGPEELTFQFTLRTRCLKKRGALWSRPKMVEVLAPEPWIYLMA